MLSEIDHQLLHVWVRRLLGREKGAPRIAVVGNCQSFGIAYGMKLLIPHAHVDRFTIVRKGVTTLDMLAKTLAGYDHVFSLEFLAVRRLIVVTMCVKCPILNVSINLAPNFIFIFVLFLFYSLLFINNMS